MNPYPLIAACLVIISVVTGAYFKGRHDEKADTAIIQQAANKAASDALVKLREELQPKVNNFYSETVKYPDCHATKEGHNALLELYK